MGTGVFKRGVASILLVFSLVFSMITFTPLASSGDWVNRPAPGGTTIEVVQGDNFIIRHRLEWSEPEDGAYTVTMAWDCYDNHENENFTFLGAEAYFDLDNDNLSDPGLDPILAVVYLDSAPSPDYPGSTRYALSVNCSADNKDNRNGQFNVDVTLGAYGVGGVPHIATDNHPIPYQFAGIIIIEPSLQMWNRAPITIRVLATGLLPHDPIYIDGNAGFTPEKGVNGGGDGTEGNPYIIENYIIDASPILPALGGIDIRNTTAYFVVRNCVVENGGKYYHGIFWYNVRNGKVENCTCGNNLNGIALYSSYNNTLTNNTFSSDNEHGVCLYSSDNNIIYHNNFVNNLTHAYDDDTNYWDGGYPFGGNYWDNYTGVDENHGENQDIPGSDGIGDTPYYIPGDSNRDRYPLMNPWPTAAWRPIETWTGTIRTIGWKLIETWTGIIEAPANWELMETWNGIIQAPTEWQLIETWGGAVESPAQWQLIETWTRTVEAPAEWQLIEIWTGTVKAPTGWQLIETWTGIVQAPAEWQLIETWTETIEAPVIWKLIETWTGTVETPAVWQLIEIWAGTVEAPDTQAPPAPMLVSPGDETTTEDTTPTFDWSDVTDPSGVTYTLEIIGTLPKTGLTTSTYTLTSGEALSDGSYSWHVRAVDGAGNVGDWSDAWTLKVETVPSPPPPSPPPPSPPEVDDVPPPVPSLVSPADGVNITDNTPLLDWSDVSDPSGVAYDLTIARDAGFTSIVLQKTNLTTSAYELTSAEALAVDTYYWRVRGVDGAGNVGSWSENWSFTNTEIPTELIENESPPVDISFITTDENATIEVENTAITGMTIVVGENVENVRITVQQLTDKPAEIAIGAPGVTYTYLNIVSENITDADIDIVLINFEVEKAWITAEDIDPDSILMWRWDSVAEVWVSLPTTRIGEDDTYYYYQAESPGLSIFGIGYVLAPAPAEFEFSNLVIDPSEVRAGKTVTISVVVAHVGGLGSYNVILKIDNVVEAAESVTLAGVATETVTFTVSSDAEGTHDIEVEGLAGTFVVTPSAPPSIVPLAITGGIVLLAGILIWLRRRRTPIAGGYPSTNGAS